MLAYENARYDQRRELGFCLNEARWARENYANFWRRVHTRCTVFPQAIFCLQFAESTLISQQIHRCFGVSTKGEQGCLWKFRAKLRFAERIAPSGIGDTDFRRNTVFTVRYFFPVVRLLAAREWRPSYPAAQIHRRPRHWNRQKGGSARPRWRWSGEGRLRAW
jgi:hypothetical protein